MTPGIKTFRVRELSRPAAAAVYVRRERARDGEVGSCVRDSMYYAMVCVDFARARPAVKTRKFRFAEV
jgi:hypothetical protein